MNQLGPDDSGVNELAMMLGVMGMAGKVEQDIAKELVTQAMKLSPGQCANDRLKALNRQYQGFLDNESFVDKVVNIAIGDKRITFSYQVAADLANEQKAKILNKALAAVHVKYYCFKELYPVLLNQDNYFNANNEIQLKTLCELMYDLRFALKIYGELIKANVWQDTKKHFERFSQYYHLANQLQPHYQHALLYFLNHTDRYTYNFSESLKSNARTHQWFFNGVEVSMAHMRERYQRDTLITSLYFQWLKTTVNADYFKTTAAFYGVESEVALEALKKQLGEKVTHHRSPQSASLQKLYEQSQRFQRQLPRVYARCFYHHSLANIAELDLNDALKAKIQAFQGQPTISKLEEIFELLLASECITEKKALEELIKTAGQFFSEQLPALPGSSAESMKFIEAYILYPYLCHINIAKQFHESPHHHKPAELQFRTYTDISVVGQEIYYQGHYGRMLEILEPEWQARLSRQIPQVDTNTRTHWPDPQLAQDVMSNIHSTLREQRKTKETAITFDINKILERLTDVNVNYGILYQLVPAVGLTAERHDKCLFDILTDIDANLSPICHYPLAVGDNITLEQYQKLCQYIDTFDSCFDDFWYFAAYMKHHPEKASLYHDSIYPRFVENWHATRITLNLFKWRLTQMFIDAKQIPLTPMLKYEQSVALTALVYQLDDGQAKQCYQQRFLSTNPYIQDYQLARALLVRGIDANTLCPGLFKVNQQRRLWQQSLPERLLHRLYWQGAHQQNPINIQDIKNVAKQYFETHSQYDESVFKIANGAFQLIFQMQYTGSPHNTIDLFTQLIELCEVYQLGLGGYGTPEAMALKQQFDSIKSTLERALAFIRPLLRTAGSTVQNTALTDRQITDLYGQYLAEAIYHHKEELAGNHISPFQKKITETHAEALEDRALAHQVLSRVRSQRQNPPLVDYEALMTAPSDDAEMQEQIDWIHLNHFCLFTLRCFDPLDVLSQQALMDLWYDLAYVILHYSDKEKYLPLLQLCTQQVASHFAYQLHQSPSDGKLAKQFQHWQSLRWTIETAFEQNESTTTQEQQLIAASRYQHVLASIGVKIKAAEYSWLQAQNAVEELNLHDWIVRAVKNCHVGDQFICAAMKVSRNPSVAKPTKLQIKLESIHEALTGQLSMTQHQPGRAQNVIAELDKFYHQLLQVNGLTTSEQLEKCCEIALAICDTWHKLLNTQTNGLNTQLAKQQIKAIESYCHNACFWLKQGLTPVTLTPQLPDLTQTLNSIQDYMTARLPVEPKGVSKREAKTARFEQEVANASIRKPEPQASAMVEAKSNKKPAKPKTKKAAKVPAAYEQPVAKQAPVAVVTAGPRTKAHAGIRNAPQKGHNENSKHDKHAKKEKQPKNTPLAMHPLALINRPVIGETERQHPVTEPTINSTRVVNAWKTNFVERHFPLPKELPTLPTEKPTTWDSHQGTFVEQYHPKPADSADDIALKLAATQLNSWEKKLQVPEDVKTLMRTLKAKGCYAVIMGGFVRDRLMNKTPNDIDMIVWGKMDEIKEAVGAGFTLTKDHRQLVREGTTDQFRIELSAVELGKSLKQVCQERDFTINTLGCALNDQNEITLVDELGYVGHIHAPTLVLVNTPDDFVDPAKILRLIRLSNELDLGIHPSLIPYAQYYGQFIYNRIDFGTYMGNIDALFWRGKATEQFSSLVALGLLPYLLPFHYQSYDPNTYQLINSFVLMQCLEIDNEAKPVNPTQEQRLQRRQRVVALLLLAELVHQVRTQKTDVERAKQDLVENIFGKFQGVAYEKLGAYYDRFCEFEKVADYALKELNERLAAHKAAKAALRPRAPVFSPAFQQSLAPGSEPNTATIDPTPLVLTHK